MANKAKERRWTLNKKKEEEKEYERWLTFDLFCLYGKYICVWSDTVAEGRETWFLFFFIGLRINPQI